MAVRVSAPAASADGRQGGPSDPAEGGSGWRYSFTHMQSPGARPKRIHVWLGGDRNPFRQHGTFYGAPLAVPPTARTPARASGPRPAPPREPRPGPPAVAPQVSGGGT